MGLRWYRVVCTKFSQCLLMIGKLILCTLSWWHLQSALLWDYLYSKHVYMCSRVWESPTQTAFCTLWLLCALYMCQWFLTWDNCKWYGICKGKTTGVQDLPYWVLCSEWNFVVHTCPSFSLLLAYYPFPEKAVCKLSHSGCHGSPLAIKPWFPFLAQHQKL